MGCGYSAPAAVEGPPPDAAAERSVRRQEDNAKSQRSAQALFQKLGGAQVVTQVRAKEKPFLHRYPRLD